MHPFTTYFYFLGQYAEFFCLEKYKTEVGKDYKRLVFYLCQKEDLEKSEELDDEESVDGKSDDETFSLNQLFNGDLPPEEMFAIDKFIDDVEKAETQSQKECSSSNVRGQTESNDVSCLVPQDATSNTDFDSCINDYRDVVNLLSSKVQHDDQFFLTMRRNAPFSRVLSLWKRQALKMDPLHDLKVHYSGEDSINSGAIALEFLEECVQEMGKVMFPDGSPVDSSLHVQNGDFRACGQLVAVSLAQGGPPPCFLEKCAYEAAFSNVDMMNISNEHLTTREVNLLEEVRSDCKKYTDLILDHGYTGTISNEHAEEIIRSLKVSFVSRRCLYMKEFMIGAKSYGLDTIIREHPSTCEPLFVNGELKNNLVPSADYLFSLMVPNYSEVGSTRRCTEEKIMDYLQDTLIAFEEENLVGHSYAVTWDDKESAEAGNQSSHGGDDQEIPEEFETPVVNIPGVMGWLTGMQHVPINGRKPNIAVDFDHDCLLRNPKHSICFPLIGACAKTLTIPVAHMRDETKFKEVFLMAYCKGRPFTKP